MSLYVYPLWVNQKGAIAMATDDCEALNLTDIPVLDLSRSGEEECLQTLRKACEDLGCFRIVNHGIPPDLLRNADLVCREVFKLPTETKIKNVSPIPFASYVGGIPTVPFYESLAMAITGARDPEAIKDFSHLMWPQGNQNFCNIMEECISQMMEVSNRVHQTILASLGMSKYYASHFNHGKALFHMNMYEVSSEFSYESIGLPPHTDGNSVTILYEDDEGGLQVLNKAGNWVDVKPIPNTLVAFIGDCFQAWSNGRIRSVKHQVTVKRQQSRLSLAFFSTFPDEMEIKAPLEFINDDHPQHYKSFKYGDMVLYRIGEGRGIQEPLHSFAGITRQ